MRKTGEKFGLTKFVNFMAGKYQAKKLYKGEYLYRGYIIVDMTSSSGYTHWNIGKADKNNEWVNEDGFFESTKTLSDAKLEVDYYVEWEKKQNNKKKE